MTKPMTLARARRMSREALDQWFLAQLDGGAIGERRIVELLQSEREGDPDHDPGGAETLELPLPLAASSPDTRGPPQNANRPPGGDSGQAATDRFHHEQSTNDSPPAAAAQLRCTGCGEPGVAPRIVWRKEGPEPVTLHPIFGWWPDQPGKPALLCKLCRAAFRARKVFKRGRRP